MTEDEKRKVVEKFCKESGLPFTVIPARDLDELLACIDVIKGTQSTHEPARYWHPDEDFGVFMDHVLVEVDLGAG